jgi:hypothetical protein
VMETMMVIMMLAVMMMKMKRGMFAVLAENTAGPKQVDLARPADNQNCSDLLQRLWVMMIIMTTKMKTKKTQRKV